MNLIEKLAKEINEKKLRKKKIFPTDILILNTKDFFDVNKINIIYKNIDFLTLKIYKSEYIINLEKNLIYPYISVDIYQIDINQITNKYLLFDRFFIVFQGIVYGNQKKVYDIYDLDKNKIGQIVLKNELAIKKNKNVINSLELTGLFFKSYGNYLNNFLSLFNINVKEQNIVKRLDYCIDIIGIETFEYIPYLKDINKEVKILKNLTATDLKKFNSYDLKEIIKSLKENQIEIKHGKKETYIKFSTLYNDLKIYDKILDLLQPGLRKRKVNGENPYKDYLDSDLPITRIELKKKNFKNLSDNSLIYYFENIESIFFDYLLRYFNINLSLFVGENISLNGKKNFLAKEKKEKSLYHSFIMAGAYLNNIQEIAGKEVLYKFLYNKFPELENIKSINLLSDLDVSDFFIGLNDDLKFNI